MIDIEARVRWVEHLGVRILFVDFSNIANTSDMILVLDAAIHIIENTEGQIRHLGDYTDCYTSSQFVGALLKAGPRVAHKVAMSAVYGIDGFKYTIGNIFYNLTPVDGKFFKTREAALAFLTREQ